MELNKIYNEDCLEGMKRIPDSSIDLIVTDPPYLYLNHKLDKSFDEDELFKEWLRVLKDKGFVVIFGRGESFYRWNTKLISLGFEFKEEIIWDKRKTTSSVLPIGRKHETISILTKKGGVINKVKIPYEQGVKYDLERLIKDIKRIGKSLYDDDYMSEVKEFLRTNEELYKGETKKKVNNISHSKMKTGDRKLAMFKAIDEGLQEKSIISLPRDNYYNSIHPTQKPVKLFERLISLVTKENERVLDCFMGSGTTAIACLNTNRNYIGFELDEEYYKTSIERINNHVKDKQIDLFEMLDN